jgi:modulator of FtsH protease HflC
MNMNGKIILMSVISVILILILSGSVYILDQRQMALIVQFGEPVAHITEPGLKFKLPFVQDVLFFDNRIQNLNADTTEVIAADQKTLRVDAFTKYRIVDALKFYQRVKDDRNFKARLSPILDSSLRQVLGDTQFKTLLTNERGVLMKKMKELVDLAARDFGVEIIDVRIMRADLPDRSREAVYDRMRSDREKEAKEIRAEGAEQAQKISATAEKEKQIILAEAKKKAEILKGQGDAAAIKAFANSFGRDPEFYEFYRTMQAYRNSLDKDSTKIIISPDNEFLKYLKKY